MRRVAVFAACAAVAVGCMTLGGTAAQAAPRVLRVAADGTGQYRTVQAAVDAVASGNRQRVTIVVNKGVYQEVVSIPADKPNIRLRGGTGDPADVVITYDNAAGTLMPGGGTYGTPGSATLTINASDVTAEDLTVVNAFDPVANPTIAAQAVAVRTVGDRIVFDHTRILGHQDTLYLDEPSTAVTTRVYVRDSYIAGTVDFIFGGAVAVFEHCTIEALDRGSTTTNGYLTAASTQLRQRYGFLFTRSDFVSTAAAKTYYLGRPWHHSGDPLAVAQVVVRDSTLGAHIKDQPWTDMSGWSWVAARFAEYHNRGAGAGVGLFRPQLSEAQAGQYTTARYLTGTDHWSPWTHREPDDERNTE